jgi:hypothetical protein
MLLADASTNPGPNDPFREVYVPKKKKNTVVAKVNHVMYCEPSDLSTGGEQQRGYMHK